MDITGRLAGCCLPATSRHIKLLALFFLSQLHLPLCSYHSTNLRWAPFLPLVRLFSFSLPLLLLSAGLSLCFPSSPFPVIPPRPALFSFFSTSSLILTFLIQLFLSSLLRYLSLSLSLSVSIHPSISRNHSFPCLSFFSLFHLPSIHFSSLALPACETAHMNYP